MGPKINTNGRENFPCIADDNVLYFASSGRQGFGGLDIFKLDLNDKEAEVINLGKPVNTDKDDFSFSLNLSKNVGYFSSNRAGKDNIYLAIPVCGVDAVAVIKDKKTGKVLADAKVSILDSKGNVIATKQSNASGEVTYQVECDTDYVLQASKNDYDASAANISKTKSRKVSISIELEPVEVVITATEVLLNAIYFEYNKSNITAQGANELDKLVKVLNNNPQMKIFVKAHTDTNGSADYNLKLSDQRAQATVQYVISKGINKERISGKGFGFTELKVNCKECTEEQDAQNRRSEFLIVKD
ncbi:MAG: hypothetical protein EOO46_08930 [Flavobacterium sp.]|nr:MAG: hypothetical protein EOO46_08930 [Flavobacterium sp.]